MKIWKRMVLLILCLLLFSGCAGEPQNESMELRWRCVQKQAVTLENGVTLDLLQQEPFLMYNYYCLSDGTPILMEEAPRGPEEIGTFQELGENAREEILAYYQERGLFYDVKSLCAKAYEEYEAYQKNGREFQSHMVSQQCWNVLYNDRIIYFITEYTFPVGGNEVDRRISCDAFNKNTGEKIDGWDLFRQPKEKVAEQIAQVAGITDEVLISEMKAAICPEWIDPGCNSFSVEFPSGSLPSVERAYCISIDGKAMREILQPWAIPFGIE